MLPNLSNELSFKDIDIKLSAKVIGKKIFIDNNNQHVLSDIDLKRYTLIEKISYDTLFDKSKKLLSTINFDGEENFAELIPSKYVTNSKLELSSLFKNKISDYYFSVLSKRYELTNKVKESTYDHSETVTGRMKIVSGVNYLTMKKSLRKDIKKSDKNTLVEIDIKSCEPALLHTILYGDVPDDVYSYFNKELPRTKVKLAVISSIYGSSIEKVRKMTGLPKQDIKKIRSHFKLDEIKKYVIDSYEKQGFFYNLYGRPIKSIASPVNYWLQSSAADYSCLAFLDLVNKKGFDLKAVIHDAVIVEVNSNQLKDLEKISKIKDPLSNIALNVEHSIIN